VERRSRPEWGRRSQPENAREERLTCLARITEETINPVEEPSKPFSVEASRYVALRKVIPEPIIHLSLGWNPSVCAENAEIAPIDVPEDQRKDQAQNLD